VNAFANPYVEEKPQRNVKKSRGANTHMEPNVIFAARDIVYIIDIK